ncbi:MAG: GerMN domain-containing protein [Acidobacteriia bacterium]|nr:GerMN domain-containing protein [Terriglobia bacterium]
MIAALLVASAVGVYYFRGFSRIVELFRRESAQPIKPFQPASTLLIKPAASVPVKLYFPSLASPGMLEEEDEEIRASELAQNRAKQIILKLIEGSKKHFGRTISQETVLKEVFLTPDGTALVDFSGAIQKNHPGGIECELQTIYSVVDSLTVNIPTIRRVRFLIDDTEADSLVGHSDLTQAFTQDLYYVARPAAATPASTTSGPAAPAPVPAPAQKEDPQRRLQSAH